MGDLQSLGARIEHALEGPVEHWVRHFLGGLSSSSMPKEGIRISEVSVCEGARPGDFRGIVSWARLAKPGPADWRRLAESIAAAPEIVKAVAVPPGIYLTLAPRVLEEVLASATACTEEPQEPGVVVVFCSPNTNKPLHIGHLRACFLGMSLSRMLQAARIPVRRSQMLSNFGAHMCQALAAYNGIETPTTAGMKPDWFVGRLYRDYHASLREKPSPDCDGMNCRANGERPCMRCRPLNLLRRMVDGDERLLAINKRLGEWAIEGIAATQARIGATYDSGLRESETLSVALEAIQRAIDTGIFRRRDDGSVYVDIHTTGDAELNLLRQNGTSLVYSMLLGIYLSRADRYLGWNTLELTGEQWRAGRRAMYELLERIGRQDIVSTTEAVFFGMVQHGDGVMSSRHGNVVLADELLERIAARVRNSDRFEPHIRSSPEVSDAFAVALLKYCVLGYPRNEGFSFNEDEMWLGTIERLLAVRWMLIEAGATDGRDGEVPSGAASLAMALARHSAVHKKALNRRDPALVVRYLDDLVKVVRATGRRGLSKDLRAALGRVVRSALSLLDIDSRVVEGLPRC